MTVHGSKTRLYWHGFDVTRAFRNAGVERTTEAAETTAFGDDAKTYIVGMRDGTLTAEGMLDTTLLVGADAGMLAALDQDAPVIVYLPDGDTHGARAHGLSGPQTAYAITSPADDVVQVSAEAQSSVGVERLVSLKPMGEESPGSPTFTSFDSGAGAGADGLVAYLHAPDVGGSLDVVVQHSADASVWEDVITFPQLVSDHGVQRIAVPDFVHRHLRVIATVAGANATFAVAVGRQPLT